ncbi:hypothetical protein [Massilia sp. TN1-12]|uniref:hypothetical protein n=1 Tax=Massilia paldalensis TaxID=3377675 RepID=UPI00384F25E0
MNAAPTQAVCRSRLADGTLLTVTATRRSRDGRADVKCSAPGDARLAERMAEVVRLARHTEARFDSRDQVVLGIDRLPAAGAGKVERDWELALVLADRMVRGLWQPRGEIVANGWSDSWQLGRVDGHGIEGAPSGTLLGGADGLAHLGQLLGHPDPAAAVSSARAWFPLHSGGVADSLGWVDVSVHPLARDGQPAEDEEQSIAVPGQDAALQLAVRQALAAARHFDGRGLGRWRTTVRFGAGRFQGRSYELALVLADRIARGREFVPRGRLLATGCSDAWHAGRVETVDGLGPKCALLLREAAPGDRILLPRAWQDGLPQGFAAGIAAAGASLACVERIGII